MGKTYHKKYIDLKGARDEMQSIYGALPKSALEGQAPNPQLLGISTADVSELSPQCFLEAWGQNMAAQVGFLYMQVKFHWNTAIPFVYVLSIAVFALYQQSEVVMTETI